MADDNYFDITSDIHTHTPFDNRKPATVTLPAYMYQEMLRDQEKLRDLKKAVRDGWHLAWDSTVFNDIVLKKAPGGTR